MDGTFVNGMRPKSKKAFKEAVKANPKDVAIEITSVFSPDEGIHNLTNMKPGSYAIVGPDPYHNRKWYGTLTVRENQKFSVK